MGINGHTILCEDYVSFETAKLLKEKRFDVPCLAHWYIGTDRHFSISNTSQNWNEEIKTDLDWLSCPTLQMAMKWLREMHNIHIDICSIWDVAHWIYQVFVITPRTAHNSHVDKILYTSHEQAVEAAIKYCLEHLI